MYLTLFLMAEVREAMVKTVTWSMKRSARPHMTSSALTATRNLVVIIVKSFSTSVIFKKLLDPSR